MKPILVTILCAFLLVNCKNKKTEDSALKGIQLLEGTQAVGIGRIEPENEIIQLSTEVGGLVQRIYKNENDSVRAGDIILELKHTIEDASITQLKSQVAIQSEQIKVDESSIKELQIRVANAEIEVRRLQNLLSTGAETKQVVDNAEVEMESFQANIKKLRAIVQVSKMKWKETNSEVAKAVAQLQQKFIKAPVDGVLLEMNIQIGNYIDSKQVFGQLSPKGKTIAVCEIDELFANKILIGQQVVIRNFGALDTLTTGTVYFASSFLKKKSLFTDQPGEKEDRRVREIKILLDNPAKILLNSRVECVVMISKMDH